MLRIIKIVLNVIKLIKRIELIDKSRDTNISYYLIFTYGKNDFAEISKNLTKYKSENNFVGLLKQIM